MTAVYIFRKLMAILIKIWFSNVTILIPSVSLFSVGVRKENVDESVVSVDRLDAIHRRMRPKSEVNLDAVMNARVLFLKSTSFLLDTVRI